MNYILEKTPLSWLIDSYWRDEAFSIILSQKSIPEIVSITAKDFSPPLYYIILKAWTSLFGDAEISTRLLSTLFYLILLLAITIYAKKVARLKKVKIAIIALALLASPILTYYAFETRMYSLAALLATLSWIFFLTGKRKYFILFSILGLYTHYFQILILLSQLIFVFFSLFSKSNTTKSLHKNVNIFIDYFAILLAFIPWIAITILNHSSSSVQSFWIKTPLFMDFINLPSTLTTGYESSFSYSYFLIPLTILIYLFFAICLYKEFTIKNTSHEGLHLFALLSWFFIPGILIYFLSFFGPSLYLPRYLIVSSPAFYFIAIHALKNDKRFIVASLFALIFMSHLVYQGLQIEFRTKESLQPVFSAINSNIDPNGVLHLESELDFHLAQYYFKYPERVYIVGKTYSELPSYVGKSLIPEERVFQNSPEGHTGYILKSDRHIEKISSTNN